MFSTMLIPTLVKKSHEVDRYPLQTQESIERDRFDFGLKHHARLLQISALHQCVFCYNTASLLCIPNARAV